MKNTFFILSIGIVLTISSCNSPQSTNLKSADSTKMADTANKTGSDKTLDSTSKNKISEPSSPWTYQNDTDKMTSKLNFFAAVNSTNTLDFKAPYDGGSTGTITLRNKAKKSEVILSIDKGQFICNVSEGCTIKVRFDESPAIEMSGTEPSDYSSTTLFIEPASKFISRAKKAKKIIVQAEFYDEGLREMEFNINGLKWEH